MNADRVLVTFPGRAGDLLWALPTIRAISELAGGPINLLIAGEFAGMLDLLRLQPYLRQIIADPNWSLSQGWEAPVGTAFQSDQVIHLGYRRWPELPLAQETYACGAQQVAALGQLPLDLTRPWITAPDEPISPLAGLPRIAVGFTECWFELKFGLLKLIEQQRWRIEHCGGPGRWVTEGGETARSWTEAAAIIAQADLLLTDCSALHVLGVAIGTPVVLVEPMEARWNPIFYPCGKSGAQVMLVIGGDGQPTFDARHTIDTITARLVHTPPKGR